jgi:putative glutamine amidotransferase
MAPLIGITSRPRSVESSAGVRPHHTLDEAYTSAVRRLGGMPVLLTPVPAEQVDDLVGRLDGLVMSGGGDIDPATYGGAVHDSMYEINPERDVFEIAVARAARTRNLPTLAICRGMQVINIAFGGRLYEDIHVHLSDAEQHSRLGEHAYERFQAVTLEEGCPVATALGATELMVNSIHHQAVSNVAPGFRVVGRASDGIIESIEVVDDPWPLWAVQWHPEFLSVRDDRDLPLFATLLAAAAAPAGA